MFLSSCNYFKLVMHDGHYPVSPIFHCISFFKLASQLLHFFNCKIPMKHLYSLFQTRNQLFLQKFNVFRFQFNMSAPFKFYLISHIIQLCALCLINIENEEDKDPLRNRILIIAGYRSTISWNRSHKNTYLTVIP